MSYPTYRKIGDHTETVQVDYDPNRLSYSQLLDIFWQNHNPESRSGSGQYMHAVFYHDDDQRRQAEASKEAIEQKLGRKVQTKVMPLHSFTMAEEYHQKYYLKANDVLKRDLQRIYPKHSDFVNSTAAARLNGYLGGYGNREQLSLEIKRLGLSERAQITLDKLVR